MVENIPSVLTAVVTCVSKNVKLDIEQFLKFQSNTCSLCIIDRLRIMYFPHGIITRDKVKMRCYEWWERLFERCCELTDEHFRQFLHGTRVDASLFHLLCGDIKRLHPHVIELQLTCIVNVRVRELEPTIEESRLTKDDIVFPYLVVLIDILCSVEPNKVTNAMSITKVCDDSLLPSAHISLLKAEDLPFNLDERHVL